MSYGTWNLRLESGSRDPGELIAIALQGWTEDYDLPAIEAEYREAVATVLAAHELTLAGDQIYGPVGLLPDFEAIREAIKDIDFWPMTARHLKDTDA
jgi:hypothetical protein